MKEEIGKRLKKRRVEKGLTQKELAARVSGGLDYTYVGKIERGDQFPSLKILDRLGTALGVPLGYFFREETPGNGPAAELRPLLNDPAGRELLMELQALHPDDLPLITEIVKVLNRHHAPSACDLPRAAEGETPYRKKK